jgi:hypothetical protein
MFVFDKKLEVPMIPSFSAAACAYLMAEVD